MSDTDLIARGHANLAERFRVGTLVEGGEVVEDAGRMLWAAAEQRFPILLNGVLPLAPVDSGALLEEAGRFFAERGRGFSLLVGRPGDDAGLDRAATEDGLFLVLPRYPAMVRRSPLSDGSLYPEVQMRRVDDPDVARDYCSVVDDAYTAAHYFPPGVLGDLPPELFMRDDSAAFVAYLDERPVSAAMCQVSHGIAGIAWVGTVGDARGRGLGEACTAAAVNAGFALGADTAWLEASSMGEPVYRRMGFEELFAYRLYAHPPPEAPEPPG